MKKFFKSTILLASSALLLAGCAKEMQGPKGLDGDVQQVTFTASIPQEMTKAVADGDGAGASVNRCIMEIYYDGSLFKRDIQPVTHGTTITATFSAQVVANRTYTVAFWADYVASTSALGTDLYYTTDATQPNGGLQAIALTGTYAGNDDKRDAFFAKESCTVAQAGTSFNVTLKRPFAQINVITTDWDKVATVSSLKPDKVDVTIQSPLSKFNAVTGEASADASVTSLNYNADLYTTPESGTDATLSMDYLFASADKAVIDIAWKAQKSGNTDVSHSFTNIPYQRNYRTNIKGALLTTTGQWNVTVDPVWENSELDFVADIEGANKIIAEKITAEADTINIKFAQQPNDAGVPGESSGGIVSKAIVTTNLKESTQLNVTVESETKALYIGDYQSETNTTVVTSGTYDATVNIIASATITTLVINAPSKTVYLNGEKISSVGTITNLDAITSQNTLIIEKNQTVTNLTVRQGGLEIHGTVTNLNIDTTGTKSNVYVRACENLSQSVFDVIYKDGEHDYIDRPCYHQKDNGNGTWDIVEYTAEDADLSLSYGGEIVGYTNMADFRDYVNGGYYFRHFTVTLLKDITITNDDNWVPIGTTDWNNAFCGIFDGNNHKITLTKTGINGDYGLFILLYGFSQDEPAVVRNLNLDVSLTAADETKTWIGGVTDEAGGYTRFENVTVSGNIVTGRFGGGFTGYNAGGICVFENCTNKANITAVIPSISGDEAYTIIGGISAQAGGSNVSYINCRNEGVLAADHTNSTSAPSYIAHMAGKGNYGSNNALTMTNCTYANTATISGWNVREGDYSTYPFEGYITPTQTYTYAGSPNPGKIMIGGYFTSCNLDGTVTEGIYPNNTPVYAEGSYSGKGINIGNIWWAPVNCGYDATSYPYGKLYQWGRKYGQGYKDNSYSDGDYPGKSGGSQSIEDISSGPLTSHPDGAVYNGKFYKGQGQNWYGGTDSDNLWGATKTSYDPCPTGWRVPTSAELEALLGAATGARTIDNGTHGASTCKGLYYDGTTGTDPTSGVFLPAAGCRNGTITGSAIDRGSYGYYRSSSASILYSGSSSTYISDFNRTCGYSVRCVFVQE